MCDNQNNAVAGPSTPTQFDFVIGDGKQKRFRMSAFNVVLGCVMALLVILCTISSMARYYIKFTIFIVLSLVCATVPMPLMLLKPFDPKNALFHILSVQRVRTSTGPLEPGLKGLSIVCFVIWTCFNMYSTWNILQLKAELRERGATSTGKKANLIGRIPAASLRALARLLGLSWTVRGLENVNNSKGTVVLLNHQSGIDLYALALIWPLMSRCTVVAKRSLQYLVPFGTATWLWGTVFIDRGAQTARDALNKQVEAIKDQKRKLLLFPEGTRHSGDRLLPFRKGAFHVAMDAGAPIQPVVVSKYHFLDDKRHKFGSGEFIVSILPMIETEGLSKDDIDALVEKTQKSMQEEFTKISTETLERLNHRANVD